jgi:hypothetical protein
MRRIDSKQDKMFSSRVGTSQGEPVSLILGLVVLLCWMVVPLLACDPDCGPCAYWDSSAEECVLYSGNDCFDN